MKTRTIFRMPLAALLAAGLVMPIPQARADEAAQLRDQVRSLQERVGQLEAQLGSRGQAVPVNGVYEQWVDPYSQMMLMERQMEHNMQRAMADNGMFNPKTDIKQTEGQYLITMDLPGMDKDKINVEVKEGMLIVSGERRREEEKDNKQYYRHERAFGTFMQAIPLPEDAQSGRIEADYKNGVLTVTIARMKKEEKKPETQKIMVK